MRDPEAIDYFTSVHTERLYNISNGDVWGGYVLDHIAPIHRDNIDGGDGFSYLEDIKYPNKSNFLKSFY